MTSITPPVSVATTTVPPTATLSAAVVDLPAVLARLELAMTLAGTVLGRDGRGLTWIKTDQGAVRLRVQAQLPTGQAINLTLQPSASGQISATVTPLAGPDAAAEGALRPPLPPTAGAAAAAAGAEPAPGLPPIRLAIVVASPQAPGLPGRVPPGGSTLGGTTLGGATPPTTAAVTLPAGAPPSAVASNTGTPATPTPATAETAAPSSSLPTTPTAPNAGQPTALASSAALPSATAPSGPSTGPQPVPGSPLPTALSFPASSQGAATPTPVASQPTATPIATPATAVATATSPSTPAGVPVSPAPPSGAMPPAATNVAPANVTIPGAAVPASAPAAASQPTGLPSGLPPTPSPAPAMASPAAASPTAFSEASFPGAGTLPSVTDPAPAAAAARGQPSANPIPAPLATTLSAPAERPGLALGTTLAVRVLAQAPPTTAGTANAPTMISAPAADRPQVVAVVVGRDPHGHVLLDSPFGRLSVDLDPRPPDGTRLLLELAGRNSERSSAPGRADSLSPRPAEENATIKSLSRTLDEVRHAAPESGKAALDAALPRPGPRLAQQILGFLAAAESGDARALLGSLADQLGDGGRGELVDQLGRQLSEFKSRTGPDGEWRFNLVPMLDGQDLDPVRLYSRRGGRNEDSAEGSDRRFIVEVELSELGRVQIDGFFRRPRIDVIVRTQVKLGAEAEGDLSLLFEQAVGAVGLVGELGFKVAATFPGPRSNDRPPARSGVLA